MRRGGLMYYTPGLNSQDSTKQLAEAATWGVLPVLPVNLLTKAGTVLSVLVIVVFGASVGRSAWLLKSPSDGVLCGIFIFLFGVVVYRIGTYCRPRVRKLRKEFARLYGECQISTYPLVAELRPIPHETRAELRRALLKYAQEL